MGFFFLIQAWLIVEFPEAREIYRSWGGRGRGPQSASLLHLAAAAAAVSSPWQPLCTHLCGEEHLALFLVKMRYQVNEIPVYCQFAKGYLILTSNGAAIKVAKLLGLFF